MESLCSLGEWLDLIISLPAETLLRLMYMHFAHFWRCGLRCDDWREHGSCQQWQCSGRRMIIIICSFSNRVYMKVKETCLKRGCNFFSVQSLRLKKPKSGQCGSVGWSVMLCTEESKIQFPVEVHAQVSISGWGTTNRCFSHPPPPQINKKKDPQVRIKITARLILQEEQNCLCLLAW